MTSEDAKVQLREIGRNYPDINPAQSQMLGNASLSELRVVLDSAAEEPPNQAMIECVADLSRSFIPHMPPEGSYPRDTLSAFILARESDRLLDRDVDTDIDPGDLS